MPRRPDLAVFRARYASALRAHVTDNEAGSQRNGAATLGRRAHRLGISTLALARIHDQAFAALRILPGATPGEDGRDARADAFFSLVLVPIEAARPAAAAARQRSRSLSASIVRSSAALTKARQRATQAVGERRARERDLTACQAEHSALRTRAERMADQLRQLARKLLISQEEERNRISRDLHDELGQTLTSVNIALASLKSSAAADAKELRHDIAETQHLIRDTMSRMHRFASKLRPPLLDHFGLVPALREYVETLARTSRLDARFTAEEERLGLGSERATALYRVAQEALANVCRHARATKVQVTVRRVPDGVEMDIQDDGRSFDVDRVDRSRKKHHLGLACMRERMDMIGGALVIRSAPGQGTTVRAVLPKSEEDRDQPG